ncbi:MAG: TrmH family RNA methyltransferase [Candidatus Promineifilaceae bacterium]
MITSTQNALVKRIRRLRQKKYRLSEGVFFVEGLRVVASALEHGAQVEQLVWCDRYLKSEFGRGLVISAEIPTNEFAPNVFKSISERDNPVGLAAIIHTPVQPLDTLNVHPSTTVVALNEIGDPGNLGTIIRTVDAAGANAVILVGNTVDVGHQSAVKASMGALFNVPIVTAQTIGQLLMWAAENKLQTIATTANTDTDYRSADYRSPTLLLMGNEGRGLSAETIAQADLAVSIPMRGVSSSLNLAIATGLMLYEITSAD